MPGNNRIWHSHQVDFQKMRGMVSSPKGSEIQWEPCPEVRYWWAAAWCHNASLGGSFSQVLLVCAAPGWGREEAHPLFCHATPAYITALFVILKWNWINSFENCISK